MKEKNSHLQLAGDWAAKIIDRSVPNNILDNISQLTSLRPFLLLIWQLKVNAMRDICGRSNVFATISHKLNNFLSTARCSESEIWMTKSCDAERRSQWRGSDTIGERPKAPWEWLKFWPENLPTRKTMLHNYDIKFQLIFANTREMFQLKKVTFGGPLWESDNVRQHKKSLYIQWAIKNNNDS